ncbi:MAG: hypothetical protein C4538_03070 [Nitrospiraceae bacterium]|nr:MAG: hypothetical protein C4538_03070 [Nitrospiraceae bacterium]
MRSFEEFAIRFSFFRKHAKIILIWFCTLSLITFAYLTYLGITSDSKLQPYSIYSSESYSEYSYIVRTYPVNLFIKNSIMGSIFPNYLKDRSDFFYAIHNRWMAVVKKKALFDLSVSFGFSAIFVVLGLSFISKRGIKTSDQSFVRGSRFAKTAEINVRIKDYRITFGKEKIRFPKSFENTGVFLFGAPGSGKSTFIKHLLPQIEGFPGIIYDRKPEFYPIFYNPKKDLLLDPIDARSIQWNIFKEIREQEDIINIVKSLVPLPVEPQHAFWYLASQQIFTAIFNLLWQTGNASNKNLIEFLYRYGSNREKLLLELRNYPQVHGYLSRDNNMSNSVMAVFSQFANALIQRHFYHDGNFSVREFINNGTGRLFIVNRIATEESFKGYYSLFLDLAFREFLCRPINRQYRFWFIIDEFPSLMKLETLEKLLAEGRDRGSCPLLGAQDFEQVKKNYGTNAYSIFNQTNTKVVFRINDPNTSEYLSKAFGEQEIVTPVKTLSTSTNRHREGYSFSEQKNVSKLILPSEIKGLETLTAFASIGEYPITKLTLDIFKEQGKNVLIPKAVPEINISFVDDKIRELLP